MARPVRVEGAGAAIIWRASKGAARNPESPLDGRASQPSSRRLNEKDKPLVYPADCEVKRISASGFLAHEGKTYHVGEAFAHKRVGLRLDGQGQTGLYFANVHLGNLVYGSEGRFRPSAYIVPPNHDSLAKSTPPPILKV